MSEPANTFSKEERLCGKASVSALIGDGRWGTTAHFRYCWRKSREDGLNRIIASVPKSILNAPSKGTFEETHPRGVPHTQGGPNGN